MRWWLVCLVGLHAAGADADLSAAMKAHMNKLKNPPPPPHAGDTLTRRTGSTAD